METVYIKTSILDITHEDQEQNGLKFAVLVQKDDEYYIKVIGEDNAILTWKTRVNGEDSSKEEIDTIIASLPNTNKDIQQLKNIVTSLIEDSLQ